MAGSFEYCLPAKRPFGPMDFEYPYKDEIFRPFKRLNEVKTHAQPIAH